MTTPEQEEGLHSEEIFPKGTTKSFALVELVRGEGPLVGKGPEDTLFSFPLVLLWEIILFLAVSLVIFIFSLIDHSRSDVGVWFASLRGRRIVGWSAFYTLVVMPAYVLLDNAFSLREMLRDIVPQWVAQGLLPALIIAILVAFPALILKRFNANTREIMLVLFTVMFISAIVFTMSGFLFRGPGFKLYWPWEMPGGYNPWNDL